MSFITCLWGYSRTAIITVCEVNDILFWMWSLLHKTINITINVWPTDLLAIRCSTADTLKLKLPRTKLVTAGQMSFTYQSLIYLNHLPLHLREKVTHSSFKTASFSQEPQHRNSQTSQPSPTQHPLPFVYIIVKSFDLLYLRECVRRLNQNNACAI